MASFIWTAVAGAAVFCAGAFGLAKTGARELFFFQEYMFGTIKSLPQFFSNENHDWLFPVTTLVLGAMAYVVHTLIDRAVPRGKGTSGQLNQRRHFGFFKNNSGGCPVQPHRSHGGSGSPFC